MAPKRLQPHNLPSPTPTFDSETDSQEHSSSSDDSDSQPQQLTQPKPRQEAQDSSESESDADSDSSSDKTQNPLSPEPKKPVLKPQQAHQESQDSSESESDDDSDSSSDKIQKPLSPEPKKSVSKPVLKPTKLKTNGKRPAEIDHIDKVNKSNKKSKGVEKVEKGSKSDSRSVEKGLKKSNGDEEGGESEDKKAGLFARLFTEKDEIVLLEGMIEFKEKKGGDPSLNIVAFHEFVEGLLSCSVTKSQITDKMRRLKKRYVTHLNKGKGGEDPVISRPHEFKLFELSKKIWGSEGLGSEVSGESKVKRSGKKMDKKDDKAGSKTPVKSVGKEREFKEEVMDKSVVHKEDWWSLYPLLCASLEAEAVQNFTGPLTPKEYVKKVVSVLNKEKARELEQEWKDLSVLEHQVYAKRLKVRSKQAEAAMNVIQH